MSWLRRKKAWPARLERRKPENAEHRAQLEEAHRQRMGARAQMASDQTDDLDDRVARVRAAVRALTIRLGPEA